MNRLIFATPLQEVLPHSYLRAIDFVSWSSCTVNLLVPYATCFVIWLNKELLHYV